MQWNSFLFKNTFKQQLKNVHKSFIINKNYQTYLFVLYSYNLLQTKTNKKYSCLSIKNTTLLTTSLFTVSHPSIYISSHSHSLSLSFSHPSIHHSIHPSSLLLIHHSITTPLHPPPPRGGVGCGGVPAHGEGHTHALTLGGGESERMRERMRERLRKEERERERDWERDWERKKERLSEIEKQRLMNCEYVCVCVNEQKKLCCANICKQITKSVFEKLIHF